MIYNKFKNSILIKKIAIYRNFLHDNVLLKYEKHIWRVFMKNYILFSIYIINDENIMTKFLIKDF